MQFNPHAHPELARVFEMPTARLLWLLWRPGHIVSDKFNEHCRAAAARLDAKPKPWTAKNVSDSFRCREVTEFDLNQWLPHALPFLNGEAELRVEILVQRDEPEVPPEHKAWIDGATYMQLLERWRNAPSGDPIFTGKSGEYYRRVMTNRRNADPAEHVAASKAIGWGGRP